jgi:hypothetical protein
MTPSPSMAASLRRLCNFWTGLSTTARWRIILGAVALGLLVWLLWSVKPWDVDPGQRAKLRHLIKIHIWTGGAFAFVILSGLIALTPWWTRPAHVKHQTSNLKAPKWFWPLIWAAMALTAIQAYPRLDFGFWDDEELCVRESLVGKFRRSEKSGEATFQRLKWEETFFGYNTPNNHVLHSILSRACGTLSRPAELPFSEFALRIPAYLFGILSVGALAWFLKDAGFVAAGPVAAFLLALHPWHIRYASEARGYSLILFLVPLLFVFWRRAATEGGWKWWGFYAVTQFALLYTYPGMLFLLALLNVLTLPALARSRDATGPFAAQSGRWFFVNSCTAALIFLLMLPLAPQASVYFGNESSRNIQLGWSWVRSALSYLLAGVPWTGSAEFVSLALLRQAHPWLLPAAVFSVVSLLALGVVTFARRGLLHAVMVAVIFTTPVLTFLLSRLRGMLIYESYIICALPGLVGLTAIGVVTAAGVFRILPADRLLTPAIATAVVLLYAGMTQNFRQWLITHPLQQIRESVQACRPTLDPRDARQDGILTGSFCIPPYLYDAHMIRLDSADEFIALLSTADQTGKPLFINIGMPWAAREYSPRMWKIFSDDRLFGDRREFLGFDAGLNRIVAKYKPGSAAGYDFSALRGTAR